MNDTDVIWRPKVTTENTGYCDRQLRNLEDAGLFPKRFKLSESGKAVGHLRSEVMAWMQARAASRDTMELKAAEEYDAETLDSEGDEEGDEEEDEEEASET